MVTSKRLVVSLLSSALLLVGGIAHTDPAPAVGVAPAAASPPAATERAATPALHHAPQVTARGSEDITIGAVVDRPDRMKRALLVFAGGGTHGEVEFARSSEGELGYVAIIPATAVRGDLGTRSSSRPRRASSCRCSPRARHLIMWWSSMPPEIDARRRSSRSSTAVARWY
jgi:hypothetical protein